jgi:glutaminyl-tRNA synthetase
VIHFVEASTALKAEFRLYDRLFTLENPGKNDHFKQLLNPKSLVVTYGIVEPSMKDAII